MNSNLKDTELEAVKDLIERGQFDEALSRCLQLSEEGSRAAQLQLGWMYQAGKGVQKDLEKAESWYSRAIRPESGAAEFYLASICFEKNDATQTVEWLERSAAKGYSPANYELGRMYRVGYGVAVDRAKSLQYREDAAGKGHLFARREIVGEMLRGRRGAFRIPSALGTLLSLALTGFRIVRKDPHHESTVTLRRHLARQS